MGTDAFAVSLDDVFRAKACSGSKEAHAEGMGKQLTQRGLFKCAVLTRIEDQRAVVAKLGESLAAGSAGHGGSVIEVGDGYRAQTDAGPLLTDRASDSCLLRATCQAIRAVFDIASGDNGAVFQQECGTDSEMAIRRIRMFGGICGKASQLGALGVRYLVGSFRVMRYGFSSVRHSRVV